MKEFPNGSKNKWTKIFKKKWFFPSLYLTLAAFLLIGVVWYQSLESRLLEGADEGVELDDRYADDPFAEDAEPVAQQEETIKMPVGEDVQTEIVTKFFDYNDDPEEQEKGLNLYNNRYYQSTGVDIAKDDGDVFDVVASLSGTVEEVKEDPLLGKVVILSHEDDVSSYYASLGEVDVEEGKKINQGDKLGISGKNLFSEESGNHVHFELRKADAQVNPEDFFNESMSTLVEFEPNEVEEEQADEEESTDDPADESNVEEELDPFEEPSEDPSEDPSEETDEEETDEEESEEDEDEVDDEEEDASLQDVSFYMTT